MQLTCDTVRSWASPAGGGVELRGSVDSPSRIAHVVVAADGRMVSNAKLGAIESGERRRWTAAIPARHRGALARLRIVARDRDGRTAILPVDASPSLASTQPWSIDEYRLALESGHHLLVCHRPSFDGTALVGDLLVVEGWSYDPSGVEECAARLDGGAPVPGINGLPTPHLFSEVGRWPGLDRAGFRVLLDVTDVPDGIRHLAVTSKSTQGHTVSWGTRVRVDSGRFYRRWLLHRRAATPWPCPPGSQTAPRLMIWPLSVTPRLIRSLREQAYPWWSIARSRDLALQDGVVAAAGADAALTVFVAGGAEVRAGALSALAGAAMRDADSQAFFADHDVYDALGRREQPWFKPAWSPEHLLEIDYLGPLFALRPAAASAVLEDDSEITSMYDLALRLIARDLPVARVPIIAATLENGAATTDPRDVRAAIERIASRRGRDVVIEELDGSRRRVSWPPAEPPLVSVVIPTTGQDGMIVRCLQSIAERGSYPRMEMVIVDTSRTGVSTETISAVSPEAAVLRQEGPFNFSSACNFGAAHATGDVFVFLNDDIIVDTPDWIERLLDHALTLGVGPVGAKLVYPNRSIQHGGTLTRLQHRNVRHLLHRIDEHAHGPHEIFGAVRNCSAVTAACLMISRREFASLNGFDEAFVLDYGDVDLCLRALAAGRRVVYTPHAILVHHESASRGSRTRVADWDLLLERWSSELPHGDPYYAAELDPYGWFGQE